MTSISWARLALDKLYEEERARLANYALSADKTGEYLSPVFGCGNADAARIVFIGEAPGKEETRLSTPFVGKAGAQFDLLLQKASLSRDSVFVTNTVKFRPTTVKTRSVSNRTPTRKEIELGLPLLKEELLVLRARVIVTLGNTPLFAMTEILGLESAHIGDVHGRALDACLSGESIILFPLYHPASGIYNRQLLQIMDADAEALGRLAATL